jgi:hypothetical protein
MLLVLALLLLGLILTADRPQLLARTEVVVAAAPERDAPRPAQPPRSQRDRPRAVVEEREAPSWRARPLAAGEIAPPHPVCHGLGRTSPHPADASPEPLFRTFCALLC